MVQAQLAAEGFSGVDGMLLAQSKFDYKGAQNWAQTYAHRDSYPATSLRLPFGALFPGDPDGGKDCTNFISHAWHLGGNLSMQSDRPEGGPKKGWWIQYISRGDNYSRFWGHAWTVVNDFRDYWAIDRAARTHYEYVDPWKSNVAYSVGDVVQMDFGGGHGFSHGAIFTWLNGKDLISQWSADRKNNAWNKFYMDASPKVRAKQRARVIHYINK